MSTSTPHRTETLPENGPGVMGLDELCRVHPDDRAVLRSKEAVAAEVQPVHAAVADALEERAA